MNNRLVTAALVAATCVEISASVAALAVLAFTPSAAAAQDNGLLDQESLRRIEMVNALERGLRQAEAARLRGECDRIKTLEGLFYGVHIKILPAELQADYQRRWREISERPCPPESAAPAAPPPPQARPDEAPAPPADNAPPAEDIPTYEAEPAPPGFGGKTPTIGVPYRDPNDPMIIPLPPKTGNTGGRAPEQGEAEGAGTAPPPEIMEPAPPPPKRIGEGASQKQAGCEEVSSDGQCETEPGKTPKRERPRSR